MVLVLDSPSRFHRKLHYLLQGGKTSVHTAGCTAQGRRGGASGTRLSPHSEFSVPSCPSGPALGEINRTDSESWFPWGRNGW